MATKKQPTFEQALSRLEEIAAGLEDGSMTLENSLKAYEEGIALVKLCEKTLQDAKLRLREGRGRDGCSHGLKNTFRRLMKPSAVIWVPPAIRAGCWTRWAIPPLPAESGSARF